MSCVCTYAPLRVPYVGNELSQRIIADCPQRQRNTLRHPERAAANIRGTVWRRFGIGLRCLLAYNGLHRPVSLSREPIPVFTVTPLRAGRRPWRDCLRKGQSLVSGEHFMFGTQQAVFSVTRNDFGNGKQLARKGEKAPPKSSLFTGRRRAPERNFYRTGGLAAFGKNRKAWKKPKPPSGAGAAGRPKRTRRKIA